MDEIYFTPLLVLIMKEYIQHKNIAKTSNPEVKELILVRQINVKLVIFIFLP